ncbi:ligand-binding sensor domain-containing protein [Desertivirga brevis]|uniref:ligand-binding sensor domain-containing protein n=1 Tax=Desertivirga brevis TaxID=2810310 RepID=UPI001A970B4E|nr:triple tyrosine motif-containing protein [Pedobacter sp. SYSU D00873]
MKRPFELLCFIVLFCLPFLTYAIEIKNVGAPYVQNYPKSVYQAGNQNWSVTKDERGVMYFGNSEGVLAFDGKHWELYQMPNRLIVRAVASDKKGKLYVGGFGEFGYWSYNNKGRFTYTSLATKIDSKSVSQDEIWKIFVDGERVIFQSFSTIYIYENEGISIVKPKQSFLFLNKSGKRFFAGIISEGLYELVGKDLRFIPGSEFLKDGILTILPFKGNSHLIGTAREGLFIYDGKTISPWEIQANALLKKNQLNNGVALPGGYFAFGTILDGIVIVDGSGNVVQRVNKSAGLQNNTVLSLFTDDKQDLWVGLDNGIDRIDITSPLYFYVDKAGKLGTVYSSIIVNDKIYLGTNQGLYYSNWSSSDKLFHSFDFKLVEKSQGQVWNLSVIDGQLLCGHNEGTFRVDNGSFQKISEIKGGWTIKELTSSQGVLVQGTYTGLVIYKKDASGNWFFSHKVSGFGSPSRFVEQDTKGNIWVSHANRGVYKLKLDAEMRRDVSIKSYDKSSGLPTDFHVNVFNLDNRIVFSSNSGFYIYDDIADKFFPYTQLNDKLGSFSTSNGIIQASENKYWLINHGKVALVEIDAGKLFVDYATFSSLNGRMVQYYENISRISKDIYLISVDEGFVVFKETRTKRPKGPLPKVLIRKIENITDSLNVLTENGDTDVEIPYSRNNIRITYSLPEYTVTAVEYQYFLEGYSNKWSEWSNLAVKDFTNLKYGEYVFKVRARVGGRDPSKITVMRFTILPPWYATNFAVAFYVVLGLVLLFVIKYFYDLKLKKHQEFIHQKFQKEQEELLQREAITNEQKIVSLKNEQLQLDLEGKNRELANSAMNIVYKNELLQKIRDELGRLKDSGGKKLASDQLRKINKVIEEGMNDERDWNLFEKSFNEAHESFFIKLKSTYPDLVPNDIKLCAYLRMNMSSKEMASLLNISVRGVEIRRYRLRKKLNLDHDKNLAEFFMEL